MAFFQHFLNRLRFRRKIKSDESTNVVDSMVKARHLYKELCLKAHPDKNINQKEIAQDLMQRIEANRYDYSSLLRLRDEVLEKLS